MYGGMGRKEGGSLNNKTLEYKYFRVEIWTTLISTAIRLDFCPNWYSLEMPVIWYSPKKKKPTNVLLIFSLISECDLFFFLQYYLSNSLREAYTCVMEQLHHSNGRNIIYTLKHKKKTIFFWYILTIVRCTLEKVLLRRINSTVEPH